MKEDPESSTVLQGKDEDLGLFDVYNLSCVLAGRGRMPAIGFARFVSDSIYDFYVFYPMARDHRALCFRGLRCDIIQLINDPERFFFRN